MRKLIQWWVMALVMFQMGCSPAGLPAKTEFTLALQTRPPSETETPVPLQLSATATPGRPLVYYYFADVNGELPREMCVVILPDILILAPALSDSLRGPDTAANLASALQAAIDDPRNAWAGEDLAVAGVTFNDGSANVALQGRITGPGDIVLIAARMQILLTIFAESPVQTAVVTINGENIANLGISRESEAKPAHYQYTRGDIENFMMKNTCGAGK